MLAFLVTILNENKIIEDTSCLDLKTLLNLTFRWLCIWELKWLKAILADSRTNKNGGNDPQISPQEYSLEEQRLGGHSQYCGIGNTGQKLSSNCERQWECICNFKCI